MSQSLDDMTEPELRDLFNKVAAMLKYHLPKGTGFFVCAAPFGTHGIAQYASNVQREDAIKWLRETATRLERRDCVPRAVD